MGPFYTPRCRRVNAVAQRRSLAILPGMLDAVLWILALAAAWLV